ncbi:MAG: hypothetical protein OEM02_08275 [Desulfobulbaceae bacterium]|nr:hypothetical protein [Desulfobulbaceae bacterium]
MIVKERLDEIFNSSYRLIQEDLSELLGKRLNLAEPQSELLSKKEYLEGLDSKMIISTIKLEGVAKDEGFLLVALRDGISIGGTLLMFPEDELSDALTNENYDEELEDAYGEVANIIAGSFTTTFKEEFKEDIRFVRTEQETFIPVEVELSEATPFPDRIYYAVRAPMGLDTEQLGNLYCILPAAFFGLVEEEKLEGEASEPVDAALEATGEQLQLTKILILTNDEKEAEFIGSVLTGSGIGVKMLGFRELQAESIPEGISCIFLVMKEVSEHGFGVAIRVNALAPNIPLVAAAPGWTKPLVMQAVRYGVGDIMLTPADMGEVRKKADRYIGG